MCYLSVKCPYDHCAAWSPAKLPGQAMPGQGLLTLPSPLQEPQSGATPWGGKREPCIFPCGCQTHSTWATLPATHPHPESLKKMRTRMVNNDCGLPSAGSPLVQLSPFMFTASLPGGTIQVLPQMRKRAAMLNAPQGHTAGKGPGHNPSHL